MHRYSSTKEKRKKETSKYEGIFSQTASQHIIVFPLDINNI